MRFSGQIYTFIYCTFVLYINISVYQKYSTIYVIIVFEKLVYGLLICNNCKFYRYDVTSYSTFDRQIKTEPFQINDFIDLYWKDTFKRIL